MVLVRATGVLFGIIWENNLKIWKDAGVTQMQRRAGCPPVRRGSIPSSSSPHVNVSLGKILNPKLLQITHVVPYGGWVGSPHCQCMNEMNVTCSVKHLKWSVD